MKFVVKSSDINSKLVILEVNEFAIYNTEQEISDLLQKAEIKTQVHYHLGSVNDEAILNRIFREYKIEIIYHAAAYKHVPILEDNIIAGITNNVFGTNFWQILQIVLALKNLSLFLQIKQCG